MNIENLDRVLKLRTELQSIDKEISCIDGDREHSVNFSIADRNCGTSWFGRKYFNRPNRIKMTNLIKCHLQEIRQEILKEIISLGVKP